MALRLYKPGQGYWVRVLTATVLGIVTLLGSVWLWKELEAVTLPVREWEFVVRGTGPVTPGATPVSLSIAADGASPATPVATGTATGLTTSASSSTIRVNNLSVQEGKAVSTATSIAVGPPGSEWTGAVIGTRSIAIFDKLYLQAAGVGALMLGATLFTFLFVGVKPGTSEFLIATDGEMKKVNWSTRKDVIGSTQVVVLWCVLLAGGLFLVDTVFSQFFQMIGVLQR